MVVIEGGLFFNSIDSDVLAARLYVEWGFVCVVVYMLF
jgi:hypothetical protein